MPLQGQKTPQKTLHGILKNATIFSEGECHTRPFLKKTPPIVIYGGIFMNASRLLEAFLKCLRTHYQATLKAHSNILSGILLKCLKGLQEAFKKNDISFSFATHIHHSITHILLPITKISFQSLIAQMNSDPQLETTLGCPTTQSTPTKFRHKRSFTFAMLMF